MKNLLYIPIIKTGDAEMRGVENLSDDMKDKITPLFELTRSRRTKRLPMGDIFRRLRGIEDVFGERQFILDLHSELTNEQIEKLQESDNGYKNWIDFLLLCKEDFPKLIPTIQISDTGINTKAEYDTRLRRQIISLDKHFDYIVYRFPILYEYYEGDLEIICNAVSSKKIICIIDADFILQGKSNDNAQKAKNILQRLDNYKTIRKVGLSGTSFPKNPTEFGDEQTGEYALEEHLFFQNVVKLTSNSTLIYGDYATINPFINDQAGGRGWVPRIDMPTESQLFYHRTRRGVRETTYVASYIKVARLMINDQRYRNVKRLIPNCWGIQQIELAAEGYPPGLSPSFWISVRMNIHMTLRIRLI